MIAEGDGGSLAGRRCLITGATGGLGRYLSRAFLGAGATVCIAGRDESRLLRLREELLSVSRADKVRGGAGSAVDTFTADFRDPAAVARLVERIRNDADGFSVLVNNAGTQGPIGPFAEVDPASWEECLRIDLFVPAALCRAAIPRMVEEGRGKIINISGGGATGPRPRFSAYAAAKSALVRLTEVLACELEGTGVDVNAISPGAMDTGMVDEVLAVGKELAGEKEFAAARGRRDTGGADPARAAALAVYLASSVCDGLTGRLVSAVWDEWERLGDTKMRVAGTDLYTLRRIVPADRGITL